MFAGTDERVEGGELRAVKFSPIGSRGSWFATWQGQSYPCVHNYWREGERRQWYNDPHARPGIAKWGEFIAAIRFDCMVIETGDIAPKDFINGSFERVDYKGLFRVDNFEIQPNENTDGLFHLRFRFSERIA